ncbi:MAG TPA: hypothetical protein VF614_11650 [Chthoniobacteraceae bacterium]|jgi:hypothetical protein
MTTLPSRWFLAAAVWCALHLPVAALDLAQFDVIAQSSGIGSATGVRITITDQLIGPGSMPRYRLFEDLLLTPEDVGKSFTANALTDTDFEVFRVLVTDGIDDGFGYVVEETPRGGGSGHSWTEANLFKAGSKIFGLGTFSSVGPLSGPDYAGYQITEVVLQVTNFTIQSSGGSSSIRFDGVATIIAAPVPELTATTMLGTALVCFSARRRRV